MRTVAPPKLDLDADLAHAFYPPPPREAVSVAFVRVRGGGAARGRGDVRRRAAGTDAGVAGGSAVSARPPPLYVIELSARPWLARSAMEGAAGGATANASGGKDASAAASASVALPTTPSSFTMQQTWFLRDVAYIRGEASTRAMPAQLLVARLRSPARERLLPVRLLTRGRDKDSWSDSATRRGSDSDSDGDSDSDNDSDNSEGGRGSCRQAPQHAGASAPPPAATAAAAAAAAAAVPLAAEAAAAAAHWPVCGECLSWDRANGNFGFVALDNDTACTVSGGGGGGGGGGGTITAAVCGAHGQPQQQPRARIRVFVNHDALVSPGRHGRFLVCGERVRLRLAEKRGKGRHNRNMRCAVEVVAEAGQTLQCEQNEQQQRRRRRRQQRDGGSAKSQDRGEKAQRS